jgi:hypothetical protein
MQITLKNVKYSEFASQETYCFEATIYLDGKKAGQVRNDGQGGCNFYYPHTIEEAINAYAVTLPPVVSGGITLNHDADWLIMNLIAEWLITRDLKRALSKRVLFINSGGVILETSALSKERLAIVLSKPEDYLKQAAKILNLLPFAEALALYRLRGEQ